MRTPALLLATAVLAAGPAFAQSAGNHRTGAHPRAVHPQRALQTGETPLDRGPFTPEANRAYQGGGVILQGAPGAPAPAPQATPPGQTPAGMVPPQ